MLIPSTIKPDAAAPPTAGTDNIRPPDTSLNPWPSDVPQPLPGDNQLDDTLTEAAGLARNADALGPYAGSF